MNARPGDVLTSLMPIGLIFVVFYFFIIRPQQRKAKLHQAMISSVGVGDVVLTTSGIIVTIKKISDAREMEVEIFHGVNCKMLKSAIVEVISSLKNGKNLQTNSNINNGKNLQINSNINSNKSDKVSHNKNFNKDLKKDDKNQSVNVQSRETNTVNRGFNNKPQGLVTNSSEVQANDSKPVNKNFNNSVKEYKKSYDAPKSISKGDIVSGSTAFKKREKPNSK